MRNRLMRFMYGRYGVDSMSKFLLWISIAIMLISTIFGLNILYFIGLIIMFYLYFRIFSKNIQKRYNENMRFLNIKNRICGKFTKIKRDSDTRKTHHIYKCPNCSQRIRIPRGKGKVAIRCPKCYTEFVKKS